MRQEHYNCYKNLVSLEVAGLKTLPINKAKYKCTKKGGPKLVPGPIWNKRSNLLKAGPDKLLI